MSFIRKLNEELAKRVNGEKIYEMMTENDGLLLGIAIVFAKESKLHHHDYTKEWYIVTSKEPKGLVYLNGKMNPLEHYDVIYIAPGIRHKLEANDPNDPLEIVAVTHPPWSSMDHHLDE
jgi:mannose-6-phosphate isomerase-like protein (cupin superfamily)